MVDGIMLIPKRVPLEGSAAFRFEEVQSSEREDAKDGEARKAIAIPNDCHMLASEMFLSEWNCGEVMLDMSADFLTCRNSFMILYSFIDHGFVICWSEPGICHALIFPYLKACYRKFDWNEVIDRVGSWWRYEIGKEA